MTSLLFDSFTIVLRHSQVIFVLGLLAGSSLATEPTAADRAFFEEKIRPVLVAHCYECHSAEAEELGGRLRLDTPSGLLTGGESGPSIVPGKPHESLLLQALLYDGVEMPPEEPLAAHIAEDFRKWIQRGAFDPRGEKQVSPSTIEPIEQHWSFRPLAASSPPNLKRSDWPFTAVDRFVLRRIEEAGLHPADDATPRVLIRRLYADLIGLPPTYEEVLAFEAACEHDRRSATVRLVDSLLASPHFGERWGRHWLDVARYAESNGNDGLGRNPTFPHAWRYRDYVIQSFNNDVPFDRFVLEQVAGDLLPSTSDAERDRNLIATGFLALTAKPAKAMNDAFDMDVVADQLDVIGRGVLGLSIGCARCHDHKSDPIPTRDYYALAGFLTSSETLWGAGGHEKLSAPATGLHLLKTPAVVLPPDGFVETAVLTESATGKPKPIPKSPHPAGTPLAMGLRDRDKPSDCKINIKGQAKKLGEPVPRGFLSALQAESPTIPTGTSGREQLAEWLTSTENPLTPRVYVNRIWLHLFGDGLVRTPDDFGTYGELPTHPKLLDQLASQFVSNGWSTKRLIREIVLSRTYQLSASTAPRVLRSDPENRLFARHNRRRLDAESLRDAMLVASGGLDAMPAVGSIIRHRDIMVQLADTLHEPSTHRSVYLCYLRNSPPPSLAAFDLPEFTKSVSLRDEATLPTQALYLFNSPFVIGEAERLAKSILVDEQAEKDRLRQLFCRTLLREPSADDLADAHRFLAASASDGVSEANAWASLAQALLISSEFRYVD